MNSIEAGPFTPKEPLDVLGTQIMIADPQNTAYGLENMPGLDSYAANFYILTQPGGIYIAPVQIPDVLLDYYVCLGIDTAGRENMYALPDGQNGQTLLGRIAENKNLVETLQKSGKIIVPYMPDTELVDFAQNFNLKLLDDLNVVTGIADKIELQRKLEMIAGVIQDATGIDVTIPSEIFSPDNHSYAIEAYDRMSEHGTRGVVINKGKGANTKGLFIVTPEGGLEKVLEIIGDEFEPDESVLLRRYQDHDFSPSMQGIVGEAGYHELYVGSQVFDTKSKNGIITLKYNSHHIPFKSSNPPITTTDIDRMLYVHQLLGEYLIAGKVSRVVGFDIVMKMLPEGGIESLGISEVNMHFPGSLATYGAIQKVHPDGLDGIAISLGVSISGMQPDQVMDKLKRSKLLVNQLHGCGVFPISLSNPESLDAVVFAANPEDLQNVIGKVNQTFS